MKVALADADGGATVRMEVAFPNGPDRITRHAVRVLIGEAGRDAAVARAIEMLLAWQADHGAAHEPDALAAQMDPDATR